MALVVGGASACSTTAAPPADVGQPAVGVTAGAATSTTPPATTIGSVTTDGATAPAGPTTAATGISSPGRGVLAGFHEVRAVVTDADGTSRELCFLLADTAALRARGLMGVTELPGHDGMVFRFGGAQQAQFYMFQTVTALDIAFYDQAGAFVNATTMVPCASKVESACARYRAGAPYADAVETLAGRAEALGLVARSRLSIGGACPALAAT
jgi:uncharacterized membrane protein (UPF0127 family)